MRPAVRPCVPPCRPAGHGGCWLLGLCWCGSSSDRRVLKARQLQRTTWLFCSPSSNLPRFLRPAARHCTSPRLLQVPTRPAVRRNLHQAGCSGGGGGGGSGGHHGRSLGCSRGNLLRQWRASSPPRRGPCPAATDVLHYWGPEGGHYHSVRYALPPPAGRPCPSQGAAFSGLEVEPGRLCGGAAQRMCTQASTSTGADI
jgi:hypothetical protein